jgi:hypothetical protein
MLLILVLVWAALVVAVCAVCAAGGAADERSERWHAHLQDDADSLMTLGETRPDVKYTTS